jgi:hypothetical protein
LGSLLAILTIKTVSDGIANQFFDPYPIADFAKCLVFLPHGNSIGDI